jgi:trans-aconitate methyltransferase
MATVELFVTDTWNPAQYDKFQREREQPFFDLIVYPHVLASRDDVVEWLKGTLLTNYQRHLPSDVYDETRPFFYPFKRILCWGQRA